ncbi:Site-specific DNA recombinase [Rhodoblastus acidophilus]|uniref:Site-specific DNA recombinase n=1 Tax=Rhodoblastus acidophilus TaxID=1074 RepID=A0A212SET5_RHOAC|nr:recombinase family protein [Rhodoblastus acidophilus]PPQ34933.1 DNA integration/recombination/inversion protein [Rhodoblastus acidophilus]RAI16787.1 DNA integration/recombination/inversion protein [Rhodoblastus acidophilus]SNB84177.1 Site-specific DNA recombinase [Rhodoblastus acidophilus]
MPKILGYARISSGSQDVESQKAVLEKAGCVVVFTETGNGSKLEGRTQLETALKLLDAGDELVAFSPDRIARDTADLLMVARRVVEMGAALRMLEPPLKFDGSDIMAEMMLTLFGLIGKVEKHFIRARQARGIAARKAANDGGYNGRPPSINPEEVRALREKGMGATAIANELKIGRASVYRLLGENGAGKSGANARAPAA